MAGADISSACRLVGDGGWQCSVSVIDERGRAAYDVSVSADELERYGALTASADELVEASFRFLLEREPRESILQHFALSVIERYFPDYGDEIGRYLGRKSH